MSDQKRKPAKTKKKSSGGKTKKDKPKDPFTKVKFLGCINSYQVKPSDSPDHQQLRVVCDFDLTAFGVTKLPDFTRLTKGRTIQCTFVDTMPELPFKDDKGKKDDDQGLLNLSNKKPDDKTDKTAA